MTTNDKRKRRVERLALLTLGGLFAVSPIANAQNTVRAATDPALAPKAQRAAMDPLQVVKQSLNLSDEQAKKLEPVLEEQRDKINALRRATSLTRQQRMAKLREIHQGRDAQIQAHLTTDQTEKWQQLSQGKRRAFGRQGSGSGNTDSLPATLEAEKAQKRLAELRSRPQIPQPPQPQPARQTTSK